jgi:hypothetical protein
MVHCAHPAPTRGTHRDRHETWGGDAMDAARIAGRAMRERTAKACRPGARMAGAKVADDDLQATVTQKPVSPGRARHSALTPSRRECRLIRLYLWYCRLRFLLQAGHG